MPYLVLIGTTFNIYEFIICKDKEAIVTLLNSSTTIKVLDRERESWSFIGYDADLIDVEQMIQAGETLYSGDNGNWKIVIKPIELLDYTNGVFNPSDLF